MPENEERAPESDTEENATDESYDIFAEISEWAGELTQWNVFAIRKLLGKAELDQQEVADLFVEFQYDEGLAEPPADRPTHTLDGVPRAGGAGAAGRVILKGIEHVQGVNALVPGGDLPVGEAITLIYGDNASGKSGYGRTLKESCYTRSQDQGVLPDVRKGASAVSPEAVFHFEVAGKPKSHRWPEQGICAELRDHFAVFDSSCVRVAV